MTKWQEFPLRPHGSPWPGLNTRGGRLDPGAGYLEDGSINAVINEEDVLAKRKGFIRGLDERFDGPVCGLFAYTDDCGAEHIVVADNAGIYARTPFSIPVFLGSDSLPNDSFEGALNATRWTPTTFYETFLGSLQLNGDDETAFSGVIPADQFLNWFKDSAISSYQVEINYNAQVGDDAQIFSVQIKKLGNVRIQGDVVWTSGQYQARLLLYDSLGAFTQLGDTLDLGGASLGDGFLRVAYDATTRTASLRVVPSGGSIATTSEQISELADLTLGSGSAVGIYRQSTLSAPQIDVVTGGRIDG
jgi:hypothetical protein